MKNYNSKEDFEYFDKVMPKYNLYQQFKLLIKYFTKGKK